MATDLCKTATPILWDGSFVTLCVHALVLGYQLVESMTSKQQGNDVASVDQTGGHR